MAEQDLYKELGLAKGASKDEIKRAYRKLARKLHPDRNPDDKVAEDRFKRVSYAHDELSDDKKRARLNCMRHFLSYFPYEGKDASIVTPPDPLLVGVPSQVVEFDSHLAE